MLRSALLIVSGNFAGSALGFARNVIIARSIPVADYGIAATFMIAISLMQMVSALGLQQMLIQAKDGDNVRLQAGLQGFEVLRGLITAVVLFALGGPIADFMNIPETAWAFRLLAVVAILNTLTHFDIHRLNRQMRFGPQLATDTGAITISVLAVWPLLLIYGDYRVMLFSLILQFFLRCAFSHLFAQRRYQVAFDREIISRGVAFGWPLLLNSAMIFCVFNGDRVIVGRELGLEALAIFSMGITLTLTPTLVFSTSMQRLFLPNLSKLGHEDTATDELARLSRAFVEAFQSIAVLLCAGMLLLGGPVVIILLGEKFASVIPLLVWFAILQAVRVLKGAPETIAISRGHTRNGMISNLPRVLTLPLVFWVAATGGDILDIILLGIAGELIGYGISLWLLRRQVGMSIRPWMPTAGATLMCMALIGLANEMPNIWTLCLAGVSCLIAFATMTELRRLAISWFRSRT